MSGGVRIRDLHDFEDLRACVRLQERVWGEGFSERAPVSILKIAVRLGGVVAGALDPAGELVGFVFGLTGLEEDRLVHWSDMLAVKPGFRDRGLGRALKLHQRERCLERGITTMYWTYDPLEARNGYLNLGKLGAVAREYHRDMYGPSDSPLHQGLGTDRLVALWRLDSDRVERRLAGVSSPPTEEEVRDLPRAFQVEETRGFLRPGAAGPVGGRKARLVPVPSRIQRVKDADAGLASAWREAVRGALGRALSEGLQVTEVVRRSDGTVDLLLEPIQDGPGEPS